MKNRVGLGTFPLAGVFSVVPTDEAKKIVRMFIEEGGHYIDAAPMYAYGYVEELLGQTLKDYKRSEYCLMTKCGYVGVEDKKLIKSSKPKDVVEECERSLKRLKMDYIDIYLVHAPDLETPFADTVATLEDLQKEGKIKEFGVCNVSLGELKLYNQNGSIKYVQNRFSLINRGVDSEFAKYLTDSKIKLMPYQSIERGQLTSKIFENYKISESDLRSSKPEWEYERYAVIAEWVKNSLFPIARKAHVPLSQLAIAWCLAQPYVGWVQVGTTNQEHLVMNLDADKININNDLIREVDKSYRELETLVKERFGKEVYEFRGLNEKHY